MEEEKKEVIEVQKAEETVSKEPEATTQNTAKNKKGICVAALVLGIVSLVLFCAWYIALPCGILAIIFGVQGMKTVNRGMAIGGLVTGAIGLLISMIIVVCIFIFGVAAGIADGLDNASYNRNYNRSYNYSLFD